MASLSDDLRRLLERIIAGADGARQIAETGAEESLKRLSVDRHEPHGALTPEERTLRNQLRAHGRQLGDKRDLQRGTQTISHLKQAVAYEHWHRLLFSRFLAENDLLMHPEHGVALTLDEVKELALEKDCDWIELAAEYAQRMLLREVFRSDDPALRVPLSPEKRRDLEAKLNVLPREVFLADDSLGWVYQFWQSDEKDRVLSSEVKIGAEELPAVTQLFTEDYMVLFLLENTLGAWWTAKRHSEGRDTTLAGYVWTYLRLNESGLPAAGAFEGWPRTAKELRVLDPSMGSGHFLVFALPILARMRVEEEGLSLREALHAVLKENLFGLEIDARCAQIAAFNLALAAWRLTGIHFALPELNLACSGVGPNASKDQWIKLGEEIAARGGMPAKSGLFITEDSLLSEPARRTMESLHELFSQAPILGSLINPVDLPVNLFQADYSAVAPLLSAVIEEHSAAEETRERVIAAAGMVKAAELLARKYTLVATNVPYLGWGKQDQVLAKHCAQHYPAAKADLATCFVERCLEFCDHRGSCAVVTPQSWLFLRTYQKLRRKLLEEVQWDFPVRLGPNAFRGMNWWAATTALLCFTAERPEPEHSFSAVDVSSSKEPFEKAIALTTNAIARVVQKDQLSAPNCPIIFENVDAHHLLSKNVVVHYGSKPGQTARVTRYVWELPKIDPSYWMFLESTPYRIGGYTGKAEVCLSLKEIRKQEIREFGVRGADAWGKKGFIVSRMNTLPVSIYCGQFFDDNAYVLVPESDEERVPIYAFLESADYRLEVRKRNQKVAVDTQSMVEVPFDPSIWVDEAAKRYPDGLPLPFSSDPTQWLFNGHPRASDAPLQVAVARLVGYQWPRQTGSSFPDCPAVGPDGLEGFAAEDGIVPLSSVAGAASASDRLRPLLAAAYGEEWSAANLVDLLGNGESLQSWLRDRFFEEHCRLFRQRPFIWHVWDGRKDGFHALVNYHKLDRRNLEKLIYLYLGDWLTRQRQDVRNGVEGADTRLAAAEHLQSELKKILEGEEPYDIFVRWKSLNKQPIGWEPDLNDSVRINIRPWITEAKLYKATKPGLLRLTPNINYTKDRGKEPDHDPNEFPWFARSSDRINDHHLSLVEKRRARGLS
jgi:hypothetical protein